ncbi:Chain A: 4ank: A Designed Ankyrin Repeat Protein With Four Identical Consensus Repeats-like protein [Dinothrombium tinctorium]|uniref:Chain A: 4ank: A Designed Ankyrin Repeat Protein With Four Identical Consensus Repeats-like protein n=1 Tax=Dinothrombium tinctorium TaxID=1965070 RepID=A0A3S3P4X5_9ACAR|nr:Chain A: 4ank: A Designed Ankyrin Repeat Protein With Four Identical Consensus Repeats-like protein [Dinothrombium tinctorium]
MAENKKNVFDVIHKKSYIYKRKEISSGKYDLNIVDDTGYSPILLAAYHGDEFLIKLLIENGAAFKDETRPFHVFCDPLHIAARNDVLDIIKMLVDKEANVNAIDSVGKTPLWYAIINLYFNNSVVLNESCHFLIEKGANFLESDVQANISSITIRHILERKRKILEHDLDFNVHGMNLSYIIFSDKVQYFNRTGLQNFSEVFCNLLVVENVRYNVVFGSRGSPIDYAISMRKNHFAYDLIKHGPNSGKNSLHFAPNSFPPLKFLLDSDFCLELNSFLENCNPLDSNEQQKDWYLHVTCYKMRSHREKTKPKMDDQELNAFHDFLYWLVEKFEA